MKNTDSSILVVESSESIVLLETLDAVKKTANVRGRILRPLGGGVTYLVVTGSAENINSAAATARTLAEGASTEMRIEVILRPAEQVWEALEELAGVSMS